MTKPPSPAGGEPPAYPLSPDLARVCLPAQGRDPQAKLARANAVCALFLLVAVVGLHAPPERTRPFEPAEDPANVWWEEAVTTEEPSKTTESTGETESSSAWEPTPEPPPVVQVEGPVEVPVLRHGPSVSSVLVPLLRERPPGSPESGRAPKSWHEEFAGSTDDGGFHPQPDYPVRLKQQRMQGVVVVRIVVSPEGLPEEVRVFQSSGFAPLDQHTCEWVRKHWRWSTGEMRYRAWKCAYVLHE